MSTTDCLQSSYSAAYSCLFSSFLFYSSLHLLALHSFPTRRSSDLLDPKTGALTLLNQESTGGDGPCHVSVDRAGKNVLAANRSEEHTSELQSRGHLVCRLLLEKKKERNKIRHTHPFQTAHMPRNSS